MFRVFACLPDGFGFVRATRSPDVALRYALSGDYLVCDPDGGCYDEDELRHLAGSSPREWPTDNDGNERGEPRMIPMVQHDDRFSPHHRGR